MGLLVSEAFAESRVALVVGNGAYRKAGKLINPTNDATAVADMLRGTGFKVVVGTDLTREGMLDKLSEFGAISRGADVALFFYAGHGIQVEGRNFLVPIDADLKTDFDAKTRSIEIDQVLQATMSEAKVKLVLLDACRDNPFVTEIKRSLASTTRSTVVQTGLAEMRSGEGTLIAFATGPGQTALDGEGRHSPFTRALLAHLPKPGVEIDLALKHVRAQVQEETRKQQLPWSNTNMTGVFYMRDAPKGQQVAALAPPVAGVPSLGADQDTLFWSSVKDSTNPSDYRAYLDKFPNGTFADLARGRIASPPKPGTVPGANQGEARSLEASLSTEDALNLDRNAWREVQRRLTHLKYDTKGIDGSVGNGTRRAITAWQQAKGFPAPGYFNRPQYEILMAETVPAATTKSDDDDAPAPAPARTTRTYRSGGGEDGGRKPAGGGGGGGVDPGQAGQFIGGVVKGLVGGGGRGFPF